MVKEWFAGIEYVTGRKKRALFVLRNILWFHPPGGRLLCKIGLHGTFWAGTSEGSNWHCARCDFMQSRYKYPMPLDQRCKFFLRACMDFLRGSG